MKDWPPGERGVGVLIDESKLPKAEQEKKKEMYQKHAFHEYVSELISYNRCITVT